MHVGVGCARVKMEIKLQETRENVVLERTNQIALSAWRHPDEADEAEDDKAEDGEAEASPTDLTIFK